MFVCKSALISKLQNNHKTMSLIPTTDPITDLLKSTTLDIVEAAHNLAAKFHNQNEQLNALPIETYLAMVNENPTVSATRFEMRGAFAAVVNTALDTVIAQSPAMTQQLKYRVPTGIGRPHVTFENGEFIYTPPPIVEEEILPPPPVQP